MVTTGGGGVKRKFFETRKSLVCLNADGQLPMDRGVNWPQEVELCPWERGNSYLSITQYLPECLLCALGYRNK